MRYLSLALFAVGMLFMPFAAKRAIMGLSDPTSGNLKTAIILLVIGLALAGAGWYISKRDDITTRFRSRKGSGRMRL